MHKQLFIICVFRISLRILYNATIGVIFKVINTISLEHYFSLMITFRRFYQNLLNFVGNNGT